jgi:hemolysin D
MSGKIKRILAGLKEACTCTEAGCSISAMKRTLNACKRAPEIICDGVKCYKNRYRPKEAEFLSGIDAVIHAPLPTVAWFLPSSIMALIFVMIMWASFSKVDIISPSMGKTVPSSHVQLIQALELGVVKQVLVREGQSVKAGQTLITFDQTEVEGDSLDLRSQLDRLLTQRARLSALAESDLEYVGPFNEPEGVHLVLLKFEKRIMEAQWESHLAELATLDQQIVSKEAEYAEALAQLNKTRNMLRFAVNRVERMDQLFKEKAVSKSGLEEMEEQLVERQQTQSVLEQTALKIEADIGYAVEQRRAAEEQFKHTILTELSACDQQIVTIEQDLLAVEKRLDQRTLEAPISGTVLDLAVHSREGVVEPASVLMRIVPEDSPLEVEAKILNRDIGFVEPGQKVEIKVETFEFTKYGSISGTIRKIAHDVTMDEQLGPVYRALIEMDSDTIKVGDKPIKLIPGMSVTVDVNVGERRLIEYILTPILRYKNESLRER